ncbi:hypothetical protein MKEN_01335200 [Mycena kentingensis (nom. inval.)]|nr:hypothetical protein MKEN_01335200 [Mycena kentingensis (nom. inval.)]
MHPSLRLSNLSRLPESIRPLATRAASGSLPDILALRSAITALAPELQVYAVCAYHAALNPLPIDTLRVLDSDASVLKYRITVLSMTIECLFSFEYARTSKVVLGPVFALVWRRIWLWIEFFDGLRDNMPTGLDLAPVYGALGRAVEISYGVESRETVLSTPGFLRTLGRAWAFIPQIGYRPFFLVFMDLEDPKRAADVDEFIDGVGGVEQAANLIFTTLSSLLPQNDDADINCASDLATLYGISSVFLGHATERDALADALYKTKIVTVCTRLSLVVGRQSLAKKPPTPSGLHSMLFTAILDAFVGPDWQKRFAEAVQAGLFDATILFSRAAEDAEVHIKGKLLPLLEKYLPRATTFHSILIPLRDVLPPFFDAELRCPAADEELQRRVTDAWKAFVVLAKDQLHTLELYENRQLTNLRGCAYPECAKVLQKSAVKRCSGCTVSFYCSSDCQKRHWRTGHRAVCAILHDHHAGKPAGYSKKDIRFIHALLNSFARRVSPETVAFGLFSILNGDLSEVTFLQFDFSDGPPKIEMGIQAGLRCPVHAGCSSDQMITYEIDRAVRSGGRMFMHLIRLPYDVVSHGVFMWHLSDGGLYQGVLSLVKAAQKRANGAQVDPSEYQVELRELADKFKNVLSTH